jgi:hypothetical protein
MAVMAGLVPATHENGDHQKSRAVFMGGRDNSPAMTRGGVLVDNR